MQHILHNPTRVARLRRVVIRTVLAYTALSAVGAALLTYL